MEVQLHNQIDKVMEIHIEVEQV